MQFGRVLACHIMNSKDKINWKNCLIEKDKEDLLVGKYRNEIKWSLKKTN